MTLLKKMLKIRNNDTGQVSMNQTLPGRPVWGEGKLEPPTTLPKEDLVSLVQSFPYWYQRIYLGQGVYTIPGYAYHETVWAHLHQTFPSNLQGASVLDVGTNAGFFALHAKLLGAGKVVGIEIIPDYQKQAEICRQIWNVDIEYRVMDAHQAGEFYNPFDIVVFTGILYHLKNPLQVLEDVGKLCQDVILVETEVIMPNPKNLVMVRQGPFGKIKITECRTGFMKFIEAYELNGDGSNWWVPDTECVMGMLRTAGFKYFSPPCYLAESRLLLVASKKENSILNLAALK